MDIQNARYDEFGSILATVNGEGVCAPPTSRIGADILARVTPAPYVPLGPTADDVRAEAQRRIIALTGTTDIIGCLIKQHNAQMRATELTLTQAQGGAWTEAEAAEAAALQGLADAIKAIRAASNVLEAMDPIPSDYADNSRWP